MIALRPYQLDGVEAARAAMRRGQRTVVFVMPTGAGKTIVAVFIILNAIRKGKRVLFIAHRRELINQTVHKLIEAGVPPERISVIMGEDQRWNPTAPIQVASIDTLRNRTLPPADIVFVDECHRALGKSFMGVIGQYPDVALLGLTATPWRLDGQGLSRVFGHMVQIATPSLLMDEGFLVAPRVWTRPDHLLPDLQSVKTQAGDYNEAELSEACNTAALVGDIVTHWRDRAEGRRTVVFAVDIAHSQAICAQFAAAGILAEHLDGKTPTKERDAILARLGSGQTQVVCNCGVLCEGWDQPAVKCAILARPTQSLTLYLQQAGRILRPWNDIGAIILDHTGNAPRHGLPQDDRRWSLHDRPKAASPTKTCPQCYAVVPSGTHTCPECQYLWPSLAEEPEAPRTRDKSHIAGELIELTARVADAEAMNLRRTIQTLVGTLARQRGMQAKDLNGLLWKKFRKSRTAMPAAELERVHHYLQGEFVHEHPVPMHEAPAPSSPEGRIRWAL